MTIAKAFGAFAFAGLISVVSTGCAADTAEEEVGESEDRLLQGRRLSPSEIAGHLRAAGFDESQVGRMVCTAKWESSFYERASNRNRNGTLDRGLFQINSIHLGSMRGCPSRANADALWNPATNAQCAYSIFKAQGNRAWYGYRKHKTECDGYRAPASANVGVADRDDDAAGPQEDSEGGCWSGTLQDMVDARTCVQSNKNSIWYQCMDGAWYRGATAASGSFGACSASHAL